MATLGPKKAVGSDAFEQLMEIWRTFPDDPDRLKRWYAKRWEAVNNSEKVEEYERIKASYNANPNGGDLVFLCRACYRGVLRFRKTDGYMSTPCGVHKPISPDSFCRRVDEWHRRTLGTEFLLLNYEAAMDMSQPGDVIYCDPPYSHSQGILYRAPIFDLLHLFEDIGRCKKRGVFVVLSIDGTKKSGSRICDIGIPKRLFEREVFLNCGRSMLRRFQMNGKKLENEVLADRLLLTY